MDALISIIRVFPFNPLSALIVSATFAFGYLRTDKGARGRKTLLVTAMAWSVYAVWELYMSNWYAPTGDHAIRVDMVLLIPLMLFITAVGVRALRKGANASASKNL